MKLRLAVLILLLLFLALGGVYLWASPSLQSASPADAARDVPSGSDLRLTFSRPMQAESILARLTTDPARKFDFRWEGATLVLRPDRPWSHNQTVQVYLAPGARSAGWPPLATRRGYRWSFTTGHPWLVYIYPWDRPSGLYEIDPQSGENRQLIEVAGTILDYDIEANGANIYLSVGQGNGGSAILKLERASGQVETLLKCERAVCRYLQVSPGGDFLAYERTELASPGNPDRPQVWVLTLKQKETTLQGGSATPSLASSPDHRTQQPDWSPSGKLIYYDFTQETFTVQDLSSGEKMHIPSMAGVPGSWSPDGESYIFTEVITDTLSQEILPSSHLVKYDLSKRIAQDMTGRAGLEDAAPVFSPDGSQIAFARRYLDLARWTPGRQLWLMGADGKNAHQVTQAPSYNHYDFAWGPEGSQLAYTRFNNSVLTEAPEIWVINLADGREWRLVTGGFDPQWLP